MLPWPGASTRTEVRGILRVPFYKNNLAIASDFSLQVLGDKSSLVTCPTGAADELSTDYCSICNCHATPVFYSPSAKLSPQFPQRPRLAVVRPDSHTVEVNEYVREMTVEIYCGRKHLTPEQSVNLVRRASSNLREVASWSLDSLDLGRLAIYLTTATSLHANAKEPRPQYMRRHGKITSSWLSKKTTDAKNSG